MHVARSVLLLFSIALSLTARAQWTPVDDHIACEVVDPEVHQDLRMMTWQGVTLEPNSVVAQALHSGSGALVGPQRTLGGDVTPYGNTGAGPKFANGSTDGIFIVYSKYEYPDRLIAYLQYDDACPSTSSPADCFNTGAEIIPPLGEEFSIAFGTEDEGTPGPAMAVYRWLDVPPSSQKQLRWRGLLGDPPETVYDEPTAAFGRMHIFRDALFSEHVHMVTQVTVLDPEGVNDAQVVLFNTDDPTPTPQFITSGDGKRFNPFGWYAPDHLTNMIVTRFEPEAGGRSDIEIYREVQRGSGNWELFRTYTAALIGEDQFARPYLLSPEPFFWRGRSYIVFSSSNDIMAGAATDGNIWIAEVVEEPAIPMTRQLNERAPGLEARSRTEGEVFFTIGLGRQPLVYYSYRREPEDPDDCTHLDMEVPPVPADSHRQVSLRRAETGL